MAASSSSAQNLLQNRNVVIAGVALLVVLLGLLVWVLFLRGSGPPPTTDVGAANGPYDPGMAFDPTMGNVPVPAGAGGFANAPVGPSMGAGDFPSGFPGTSGTATPPPRKPEVNVPHRRDPFQLNRELEGVWAAYERERERLEQAQPTAPAELAPLPALYATFRAENPRPRVREEEEQFIGAEPELDIRLLGVRVGANASVIFSVAGQVVGPVRPGSEIGGGYRLDRIERDRVLLSRPKAFGEGREIVEISLVDEQEALSRRSRDATLRGGAPGQPAAPGGGRRGGPGGGAATAGN